MSLYGDVNNLADEHFLFCCCKQAADGAFERIRGSIISFAEAAEHFLFGYRNDAVVWVMNSKIEGNAQLLFSRREQLR